MKYTRHPKAQPLRRAHDTDSGLDLSAMIIDDSDGIEISEISVPPGRTRKIRTGVSVELPPGTEGQIRPRSSLSARGIHVALGTIDNGYRGELVVTVMNHSDNYFWVENGDRIAQLVVAPVLYPVPEEVEALSETERGAGGYGSTGK